MTPTPAQIQQFIDHLEKEGYVLCKKEPVATLHDDGCFTWTSEGTRLAYRSSFAGWKMAVYSAAPPYAMKEGES